MPCNIPSFPPSLACTVASTPTSAIVDDHDLSVVQYFGQWGGYGTTVEFDSTTSVPQVQGASVLFSFVGTSIQPFATVGGNLVVFMSIDNGAFTATFQHSESDTPIYHQPLWILDPLPSLSDGSHTLLINQTSDVYDGTFYLDYFIYNVSASTPMRGVTFFVDDRDPGVKYGDGWEQFSSDVDFMYTATGSSAAGSNVSYTFEGIGISVYGDFQGDTEGEMMEARIVIDNGPPANFAPTPQQSENITNNYQYFYTDGLEQGEHTITITALNNNTVWIDYFLVVPGDVSVTPTATGTPPAVSSTRLPAVSLTSTSQSKKLKVGAIVEGTMGGISILVALLFLVFWIRRRKKQSQALESHRISSVLFLSPSPRVSSVSLMANRFSRTHRSQRSTQMQSISALPVPTAGASLPERSVDSGVHLTHELPPD